MSGGLEQAAKTLNEQRREKDERVTKRTEKILEVIERVFSRPLAKEIAEVLDD